ncbi:MAG: phosphoribosylglycinamide formyltransferase [Bdellovibrionota bacterium]
MKKKALIPVFVFASGRGSNFEALCQAVHAGKLNADIRALVSNTDGCGATEIARMFKVPVIAVSHKGCGREQHEKKILEALPQAERPWIVLAGYMRLLTKEFIERFWDSELGVSRIVNIHPSLLPAFPGTSGYRQALEYGVKVTGATVHLVTTGLDDGPVVLQRSFEVRDDDTLEALLKRGLAVEHELYSEALYKLFNHSWRLSRGSEGAGRPRVVFGGEA